MIPRLFAWFLGAAIGAVLLPSTAFAQATIAGLVRDTSGAVLPGVTVEAASGVLIEKARTAVTDGSGQYRIVDLRAGSYSVTFTLPGFSHGETRGHRADRRRSRRRSTPTCASGAIEETVTVTGETPIVDVQSVRRQATISGDVAQRDSHRARLQRRDAAGAGDPDAGLVARQRADDARHGRVRHARRPQRQRGPAAGGRPGRRRGAQRRRRVGLQRRHRQRAGDLVHRVGRPRRSGGVGAGAQRRAEDRRQQRAAARCTSPASARAWSAATTRRSCRPPGSARRGGCCKLWDFTGGIGGPIKKDRLWYFLNLRNQGSHSSVSGMFANKNAGDPTKWTYEADPTRQSRTAASWSVASLRLTVAGHAAQQVQRLLGRAEAVHRRHLLGERGRVPHAAGRRRLRLRRRGHRRARDGHLREPLSARAAAHVDVAAHQPRPAHRRLRRLPHAAGAATRCPATRRAAWCASPSSARRRAPPTAASPTSPTARRTGRRTGWGSTTGTRRSPTSPARTT